MPEWSLEFTKRAEKDLDSVDRPVRVRIVEKLEWLLENFDSLFPAPLAAEWSDFFKLRVGDWRVVYRVDYKVSYCCRLY